MIKLPSSFGLLWSQMTSTDRRRFSFMTLLAVVNGLLDLIGVITLFVVVAIILDPDSLLATFFFIQMESWFRLENLWYPEYILPAAFLSGLFLIKNVLAFFISRKQVMLSFQINQSVSDAMIESHLWADARHHRMEHSTESINRLSTVSLYLADTLIIASLTLFSELFVSFLILLFAAVAWPGLFFYLLISVIPVALIIMAYNRRRLRSLGDENNKLTPEIYHTITDSIYGYEEIRLSSTEGLFYKKFRRLRDQVYSNRQKITLLSDHYHFRVLETLVVVSLLAIVMLTILRSQPEDITLILAMYSAIAFRLIPSVSRIVGSFNSLSSYHYIANMITDKDHPLRKEEEEQQPLAQLDQQIQLEHLYFAFQNEHYVVQDINVSFKKGEVIGIQGPSGAGKTTLLNLVMGFYFPTSGAVKVDGSLLTEHNMQSWQQQIACVRQNAFLLSGTIAENVAFGQEHAEVDLQAVHLCLAKVGLWDWVKTLPDGLATQVGELGNSISGGQRQRLAIARAIFKNANIFIFDEPTTSLDHDSAVEVMNAILDLKSDNTLLIIVSHDDRILSQTDQRYTILNGRLEPVG